MLKKVQPTDKLDAPQRLTEPTKIPGGYSLKDPSDGLEWPHTGLMAVQLTFGCGVSFPMFAATVWQYILDPDPVNLLLILFLSIPVAFGVIGLIWGGKIVYRVFRLKVGELILPTYPLHQGETYRVKYRRAMRQGETGAPTKVSASWINYEWVQYERGTDIETDIHELDRTELGAKKIRAGVKQIEYIAHITVPKNLPASRHDTPHNQVRWGLQVNIHIPRVIKGNSHFVVKVLPARF